MSSARLLSPHRIAHCRGEARAVLDRFFVKSPSAIDLETFAWYVGKLRIKIGGLTGSEGRLVAIPDLGGVIRVARNSNIGRYRFTVAHEIGHFCLHQSKVIDHTVLREDFGIWNDAREEAEANYFAAELLMPEFLFRPRCRGIRPSVSHLDSLTTEFRTSLLATAFQFWEYTSEPLAVVVSEGWNIRSFCRFKDGWPRLRLEQVHQDSAAGDRLAGRAKDSGGMVRTPAYAWLEGFDNSESDIMEDSLYLEFYDTTLTLLWIDEEL